MRTVIMVGELQLIFPIFCPPCIDALYKLALQLFPWKAGDCFPMS